MDQKKINWIAKLFSLLLAIAIWYLIKDNLEDNGGFMNPPPKAVPVRER
jgi:ABC-type nitrate/sulfonate/bicarbonate transport system permease component